MTYAEFGEAFVREAVTPARIVAVIRDLAGDRIEVGPIKAGPGGVADAIGVGTLGEPTVRRTDGEPLTYIATVPVDVDLSVDVGGTRHRFTSQATVEIRIPVLLVEPLAICVDPSPPTSRDVTVKTKAQGMQAKLIGRVGDVDGELRRHIARYVAERIDSGSDLFASIDLRVLIETAWPSD